MTSSLHPKARRARNTLLIAGILFCTAQLVGGLLLDYRWPELRFPSAAATFTNLRKHQRPPDIICLGSSRFGAAFSQEHIRDRIREETGDSSVLVFNSSIEAGDLVTADFLMEHILAEEIRPQIVVIEVSPETVAQRNEWLGQDVIRQLNWEDLPDYLGDVCRSGNLVRLMSARLTPLLMHRKEICRHVFDGLEHIDAPSPATGKGRKKERRLVPPDTQGVPWDVFLGMNGALDTPLRTQAGLPVIRRWLKDYQVGGTSTQALERLLLRCREKGMTIILVGAPLCSAHRQLYTPEIDQAFLDHMQDVSRRHECRFVDYRDRIPDRLFLDNHHLLRKGGEQFSRLLTQEVLLPVWRERQQLPTNALTSRQPR